MKGAGPPSCVSEKLGAALSCWIEEHRAQGQAGVHERSLSAALDMWKVSGKEA